MSLKGWIPVFVAALTLIACAAAQAAPATPELEADYASALAWWGQSAPPLCVSVTLESDSTPPNAEQVDDPAGETVWATATEPDAAGPCFLSAFESWTAAPTCLKEMVIRHEVGHLLGYGHSTDPTNIMYPTVTLQVWCPELVAAPTPAPAAPTAAPVASATAPPSESAEDRRAWLNQRARCERLVGHASAKHLRGCWGWVAQERAEYRMAVRERR